jgi:glycosyltransferase involved in cell wall biosynthesis
LLHAHDHTSLPAALAALSALDRDGGRVPLVYDAHEFVPGLPAPSPVWAAAADHAERAGAARADAVITVSDLLADQLVERLALPARPVVVANAPLVDATGPAPAVEGIRSVVGVDEGVPLLVYAGGVAPQRGLSTVVHALADLPDVHLALVSAPSPWLDDLLDLAGRRGVGDRVHVAPYVSAEQVPAYLAGGDAGVIPLLHSANHEVAMSTKWYDYAHAGLPVVVSDVRSMARECRRLGNGEVFTSGDATSLAAAVRAVLADPQRYRRAYSSEVLATGTWQHQALGMLALYRTLTGAAPTRGAPTTFAVRSGQPGR